MSEKKELRPLSGSLDTSGYGKVIGGDGMGVELRRGEDKRDEDGNVIDSPNWITVVPHVYTYGAVVNQFSQTYQFNFDEALRKGWSEATSMRNDGGLIGLLWQRYYPVACAKWKVTSKGPEASEDVNSFYTDLLEQTPLWHQFRWQLLESVWYGRYGIQFATGSTIRNGPAFEVEGGKAVGISQWIPHQGDKITFTWDFEPCIRVSPFYAPQWRARGATVLEWDDDRLAHDSIHTTWSERGPVVLIDKPWIREMFAFPIWMIADAPWDQPDMAGAVRGIGLRNFVFWLWWMRQKLVGWAMNYLQDFGAGGYTVVGYDAGNPNALNRAKQSFADPEKRIIFVPITPGEEKVTETVTRLNSGGTGNDAMQSWADTYFEAKIALLITGQPGSSKQSNNGLGSNRHEMDQENKQLLHLYDKSVIDGTMTQDILTVLKRKNHGQSKFTLKFESILREADKDAVLKKAKGAFDMGAKIGKAWLLSALDIPEPQEGEETLSKEEMDRMHASLQMAKGMGSGGDMMLQSGHGDVMEGHDEASLEEARKALESKGVPVENQLKYLAGLVESGQLEEHDTPEGLMYTPSSGANPLGGGDDAEVGHAGDGKNRGGRSSNNGIPQGKDGIRSRGGDKKAVGKEKLLRDAAGRNGNFTHHRNGNTYSAQRGMWTEEVGPRSGKPRWINNETGRIVYTPPGEQGDNGSYEEERPTNGLENYQNYQKTGKTNFEMQRDERKSAAVEERFHALADREGQVIEGKGIDTEVAHLDKNLSHIQVLKLAAQYGMNITSMTSKTAGLAHLDGVLRGSVTAERSGEQVDAQGVPVGRFGGRLQEALRGKENVRNDKSAIENGNGRGRNNTGGSSLTPAGGKADLGTGKQGDDKAGRVVHSPAGNKGAGGQAGESAADKNDSGKSHNRSEAGEQQASRTSLSPQTDAGTERNIQSAADDGERLRRGEVSDVELGGEKKASPQDSAKADNAGKLQSGSKGAVPGSDSSPGNGPAVGVSAPAPIGELHVDPERFQYKLGTDTKTGVGKSLSKFNKAYAGSILTWVDPADGKEYVVNGHHRYDRAKKDGETEINRIRIQAGSAEEARAIGAYANIADDKGTSTDVAKLLKDQPEISTDKLIESGVAKDSKLMTEGVELAKLEPSLFRKLTLGTMEEKRGLSIARGAGEDHAAQKVALGLIEKAEESGKNVTDQQAMYIAQDAALAGKTKGEEGGLFGDMEDEKSLHLERAQLKAAVAGELGKIKNAFGAVSTKGRAEMLGQEGNKIELEKNKGRKAEAEGMQSIFNEAVKVKGPLNDYLNEQSEKLSKAKGKEATAIRAETIEGARKLLQERMSSNTMAGSSDQSSKPVVERQPGSVEAGSGPSPDMGRDEPHVTGGSFPEPFMQQPAGGKYTAENIESLAGQSFTSKNGLTVDLKRDADGTWSVGSKSGLSLQGAANMLNLLNADVAQGLFGKEVTEQAWSKKPSEKLEWSKQTERKEGRDLPGMRDAYAPGMFAK